MTHEELKERILTKAKELAPRGAGWAQESIVLREVAEELKIGKDVAQQQAILTAWHDLFREGRLSWGHDINNPRSPFFHVPDRAEGLVSERAEEVAAS
jgi:hypothetical protein